MSNDSMRRWNRSTLAIGMGGLAFWAPVFTALALNYFEQISIKEVVDYWPHTHAAGAVLAVLVYHLLKPKQGA